MKDNKSVLNEAFFKKTSYSEKRKSEMPAYSPVPGPSGKTFGSQAPVISGGSFAVSDPQEMKKRLTGTFGAAFGGNNIRSMAGKAIKSFPIIVSDNIEPETVMNLKRLMEEQYADYISLLISNKVIDLGAFDTASADGSTIAIQALDSISGTDFSKNRLANKAMNTGALTMDDIGANTPLYNLLRENHIELNTGDALFNELFENALVVPSDKADDLVKYICENADSLILNEWELPTTVEYGPNRQASRIEGKAAYAEYLAKGKAAEAQDNKVTDLQTALQNTVDKYDLTVKKINGYDKVLDTYTGKVDNGVYTKLSNAEILVDKGQFDAVMNRTVGELLMDPKNAAIKDRFEKAAILLQAEMITGSEFIDYCTLRLGIPISATARATLSTRFRRAKSVERKDDYKNGIFMTDEELRKIKQNQKVFDKVCPKILNAKIGSIVAGTVGTIGGAGVGGAVAGILALAGSTLLWPVILGGALVGGAGSAVGYLIYRASKKRAANKTKIEGWERVEALIETMDKQRADLISHYNSSVNPSNPKLTSDSIYNTVIDNSSVINAKKGEFKYKETLKDIDNPARLMSKEEQDDALNHVESSMKKAMTLAEACTGYNDTPAFHFDVEYLEECADIFNEAFDECMEEKSFKNCLLEASLLEKKKESTMPMKIKYVEKKPNKDLLIAPEFSARSTYAYGTTEIDSRAMKDRKYNQPLLMKISFRERFDDGKFSDNELTAVIGILGKVIRVPSNEMEYILQRNIEGETIEGIFKSGNIKNMVSDLLSVSKINADVKNLPQSADVWKNLEKVAALAVANKYSGKKSGNVANAHIVFSEKEIDDVRVNTGTDYKRDMKLVNQLMKHYSAFTLMIADDPAQRVYIYNDEDDISWNVVPYSAIMGKDTGDQLTSALSKLSRI